MQTILVTGANGFVGQYLVHRLLSKFDKVIAAGKGACRLPFRALNLVYVSLDITDKSAVQNCIQTYQPNFIVHSGAMSKPDECEQHRAQAFSTNVSATHYLLEAAAAIKSFFLFISTDFVFSGEQDVYTEEDKPAPVNYYGETKMAAEAAVLQYPFAWSIVRTVLVYGKPGVGRQNILTNVAAALQRNEPLKIFNDQVRTPTYVEDLVNGLLAIIDKKATGIFHLSGEDILTPYEMALAVARHLGLDENLIEPATAAGFQQPALRPRRTVFDLSKAKAVLSYRPVSFLEGLQKTFE